MNYEDIHAGMTLLEPRNPSDGNRGPAVRVIRHDKRWGLNGAWICRNTEGKRINIWPGIARLYVIGTAQDWGTGSSHARAKAARAVKAKVRA